MTPSPPHIRAIISHSLQAMRNAIVYCFFNKHNLPITMETVQKAKETVKQAGAKVAEKLGMQGEGTTPEQKTTPTPTTATQVNGRGR